MLYITHKGEWYLRQAVPKLEAAHERIKSTYDERRSKGLHISYPSELNQRVTILYDIQHEPKSRVQYIEEKRLANTQWNVKWPKRWQQAVNFTNRVIDELLRLGYLEGE